MQGTKTLETILQDYFGVKRPFLKTPERHWDGMDRYLSRAGEKAYGRLVSLLYDLEDILENFSASEIIEELDQIADGDIY